MVGIGTVTELNTDVTLTVHGKVQCKVNGVI